MRLIYTITAMLLLSGIDINAQENNKNPKGKAIVQVFTNFHSGFGARNDDRGFDLDRSYLGYEYSFNKGLTIKGVIDIGQSSDINDYQRIAYIKNALISWEHNRLTLNAGLIATTQASYQKNFWGYRYIYRTFQDEYGFGSRCHHCKR